MSSRPPRDTPAELQAELDLLEAIVSGDDRLYPWNPSDSPTSDPTARSEPPFTADLAADLDFKIDDLDLGDREAAFFQQLDTCTLAAQLTAQLGDRFGSRVPADILQTIARRGTQLVDRSGSFAERLVNCATAVLPNWSSDDLQVLARPLAYAMRGEAPEARVRRAPWTELSALERARLSLAIAHCTLSMLESSDRE